MCGVASVVAMLTIGEGARRETIHQISQLGLENVIIRAASNEEEAGKAWREAGLQFNDRYSLENIGVFQQSTVVKELGWRLAELGSKLSLSVLATEPTFAGINGLIIAEGRFLHDLDIQKKSHICVLGADVAKSLADFGEVGKTITLDWETYTIVGRLAPMEWSASQSGVIRARNFNQSVFVPLFPNDGENVSEIIAQVGKGNDVIAAGHLVERNLRISREGLRPAQVVVPLALLRQAEESQNLFNVILGSIAGISLLVGGIGIMNIMLASVAERTPEIGLRRAVGASRQDIMAQFLAEAMFIGIGGGSTGLIFGIVGSVIVSIAGGWPTALTSLALILPVVMSLVVTGIAGLYPAWLAAKVDPIKALRQSPW